MNPGQRMCNYFRVNLKQVLFQQFWLSSGSLHPHDAVCSGYRIHEEGTASYERVFTEKCSPYNIRMIKSKTIRWAGHVA
jgi:hypothetical protein